MSKDFLSVCNLVINKCSILKTFRACKIKLFQYLDNVIKSVSNYENNISGVESLNLSFLVVSLSSLASTDFLFSSTVSKSFRTENF